MIGRVVGSGDERPSDRRTRRRRHSRSANDVEPSGRCARTSRTRPPTKAQTRPASRPTATVHDDPDDEHEVRFGVADPKVRTDGQFEQGRHRRTDRGEEQGHRASRSSARRAEGRAPAGTAPRRTVERRRRRGAVSHGPLDPGNGLPGSRIDPGGSRRVACFVTAERPRSEADGRTADAAVSRETGPSSRSSEARHVGPTFHVKRRDRR